MSFEDFNFENNRSKLLDLVCDSIGKFIYSSYPQADFCGPPAHNDSPDGFSKKNETKSGKNMVEVAVIVELFAKVCLQVTNELDGNLLNGLHIGLAEEHQYVNAGLAIMLSYTWLQRTGHYEVKPVDQPNKIFALASG
ncbi:hypothetical protein L1987_29668 [Smallanthus sonchifolius]|uniref:Uncharacterized protein n=1 Tax=Smallanthus sonchifolius TaxID=185202 RepID=A0ACB9I2F3_9ASTR|nr:hypothetical protein L1987_29668 [Smallanthus sonchifolius]